MANYQIKISYQTGDSFSTEDDEKILEYQWNNLEIVRENLQRIKAHYEWYNSTSNDRDQKWKKTVPKFCAPHTSSKWGASSKYDYSILLLADNGKSEYQLYPFWVGYFESLHCVEIVIDSSKDKIYFH